jgi:hypothetical protein
MKKQGKPGEAAGMVKSAPQMCHKCHNSLKNAQDTVQWWNCLYTIYYDSTYIQTHIIQPKKQEGSLKSKKKQQEWAEKADLIGPSQLGSAAPPSCRAILGA